MASDPVLGYRAAVVTTEDAKNAIGMVAEKLGGSPVLLFLVVIFGVAGGIFFLNAQEARKAFANNLATVEVHRHEEILESLEALRACQDDVTKAWSESCSQSAGGAARAYPPYPWEVGRIIPVPDLSERD